METRTLKQVPGRGHPVRDDTGAFEEAQSWGGPSLAGLGQAPEKWLALGESRPP